MPQRTGPEAGPKSRTGVSQRRAGSNRVEARVGTGTAHRTGVGGYSGGTPAGRRPKKRGKKMRIERRYTKEGQSPYAGIEFRLTTSEIRNPDGSVVFHADDVEVPTAWSQVAADVIAQKYFRKAGVPARLKKVEEETVPSWLWRSVPDEEALAGVCPRRSASSASVRPSRCSSGSPAPGPTGAGRAGISIRRATRAPSSTSSSTCSPRRWRRRTRRNGSTPACTGPTASTARARATTTSTSRPAS